MTFESVKNNPSSNKIVIVEIDLPTGRVPCVINYEAGMWYCMLTPGDDKIKGSDGLEGYWEGQNKIIIHAIGSARIGSVILQKVSSVDECRLQNLSFYYDAGSTIVYFHFDNYDWPTDGEIVLGVTAGFCDKADRINGSYYNKTYYEPRVKSVPTLTKNKDPLFFGVLRYQGSSISLINTDGFFDSFTQGQLFGQMARVLFGFEGLEYDQFRLVFSGFIEDFGIDFETLTINVQDKRKQLSRKLPTRVYTVDDYPWLNEDNNNQPKPLAYGPIRRAPTVCLNETQAAANYTFSFMDTTDHAATSVDAVYADGVEVSPASVDLSAGTFVLSSANCMSSGSLKEITCDFTGASGVSKGPDIIKDLMGLYFSTAYIATNFNIGEWNYENTLAPVCGVYIDEDIELNKIIEQICASCNMIFFVQDDGRFTLRSYNENKTHRRVIYSDEWIDAPKTKYPSDQFLTSCKVLYDKSVASDEWRRYINTTYEQDVVDIYKQYKERSFETLLTSEDDADAFSEDIMAISQEIGANIVRKVKTQHIDLELMDFIVAEHSRLQAAEMSWGVYEIIGTQKNLSAAEVTLTMRHVRDYTFPSWSYLQGIIWGHKIFGHKIHSVTTYTRA